MSFSVKDKMKMRGSSFKKKEKSVIKGNTKFSFLLQCLSQLVMVPFTCYLMLWSLRHGGTFWGWPTNSLATGPLQMLKFKLHSFHGSKSITALLIFFPNHHKIAQPSLACEPPKNGIWLIAYNLPTSDLDNPCSHWTFTTHVPTKSSVQRENVVMAPTEMKSSY